MTYQTMIDENIKYPFCVYEPCKYEEEEKSIIIETWTTNEGIVEVPKGDHPMCPKCGTEMLW